MLVLPDEETRHVVQVMRMKVGEQINIVDGKGIWYKANIVELMRKHCAVKIFETEDRSALHDYKVNIAIAPTKNINRFEWFLEKVTEIGINSISPIFCERSERKKVRMDRLHKVMVAAMKQSLKAKLPLLNEPVRFDDFVEQKLEEQKFIAYLGEDVKGHLKSNYEKEQNVTILIGPEGDFSDDEIQKAKGKGFIGVSLGPSRLRTETAGIAACHIINLLNQ
ncbi:MAG: 16S rRNA (uracil(1498)-N(3))-methyltransferase [Bacteroidota bacterium]